MGAGANKSTPSGVRVKLQGCVCVCVCVVGGGYFAQCVQHSVCKRHPCVHVQMAPEKFCRGKYACTQNEQQRI